METTPTRATDVVDPIILGVGPHMFCPRTPTLYTTTVANSPDGLLCGSRKGGGRAPRSWSPSGKVFGKRQMVRFGGLRGGGPEPPFPVLFEGPLRGVVQSHPSLFGSRGL